MQDLTILELEDPARKDQEVQKIQGTWEFRASIHNPFYFKTVLSNANTTLQLIDILRLYLKRS